MNSSFVEILQADIETRLKPNAVIAKITSLVLLLRFNLPAMNRGEYMPPIIHTAVNKLNGIDAAE